MLESDEDMKALASKTEMLISQHPQQDNQESKEIVARATMKLFKA